MAYIHSLRLNNKNEQRYINFQLRKHELGKYIKYRFRLKPTKEKKRKYKDDHNRNTLNMAKTD